MVRGNEKRDIFIDDEDRIRYRDTLADKIKDGCYRLYAYCLMDNHVHIIIRESGKGISDIMGRVGTSYAIYFNKKVEQYLSRRNERRT